jgi:hypothetical protein
LAHLKQQSAWLSEDGFDGGKRVRHCYPLGWIVPERTRFMQGGLWAP